MMGSFKGLNAAVQQLILSSVKAAGPCSWEFAAAKLCEC